MLTKQKEQVWFTQQCLAAYNEMSRFGDCDSALLVAKTRLWDIINRTDKVETFLVIPALVCCILWAGLGVKLLYK